MRDLDDIFCSPCECRLRQSCRTLQQVVAMLLSAPLNALQFLDHITLLHASDSRPLLNQLTQPNKRERLQDGIRLPAACGVVLLSETEARLTSSMRAISWTLWVVIRKLLFPVGSSPNLADIFLLFLYLGLCDLGNWLRNTGCYMLCLFHQPFPCFNSGDIQEHKPTLSHPHLAT